MSLPVETRVDYRRAIRFTGPRIKRYRRAPRSMVSGVRQTFRQL